MLETVITMNPKLLVMNPILYEYPHSFIPERWLGDSSATRPAKQHAATWGIGSRLCLGREYVNPTLVFVKGPNRVIRLAIQTLAKLTAVVLCNYDVTFWNEEQRDAEKMGYLKLFADGNMHGMNIQVQTRSYS